MNNSKSQNLTQDLRNLVIMIQRITQMKKMVSYFLHNNQGKALRPSRYLQRCTSKNWIEKADRAREINIPVVSRDKNALVVV